MQSETKPGLWSVLPLSFRSAIILAVATSVVAGTLLWQSGSSSSPPDFRRGGRFSGITEGGTAIDDLSLPTSTPATATLRPRSSAVLRAPDPGDIAPGPGSPSELPAFGTYVYDVVGSESLSAFGSRTYPSEMTMTVQRLQEAEEGSASGLDGDELVFDLFFSEEHEEREIVSYSGKGVSFTYEANSITFGPVTQTSETDYEPPMLQVPLPIDEDATYKGTTRATDAEGAERRVEDWTVTVEGAEVIEALAGEQINTWRVTIERQSQTGSAEQLTKTRTYWFDPTRTIWVKWEERTRSTQDFGPGTFTYDTNFVATLDRIEPL
jgi:hypothetical protein